MPSAARPRRSHRPTNQASQGETSARHPSTTTGLPAVVICPIEGAAPSSDYPGHRGLLELEMLEILLEKPTTKVAVNMAASQAEVLRYVEVAVAAERRRGVDVPVDVHLEINANRHPAGDWVSVNELTRAVRWGLLIGRERRARVDPHIDSVGYLWTGIHIHRRLSGATPYWSRADTATALRRFFGEGPAITFTPDIEQRGTVEVSHRTWVGQPSVAHSSFGEVGLWPSLGHQWKRDDGGAFRLVEK